MPASAAQIVGVETCRAVQNGVGSLTLFHHSVERIVEELYWIDEHCFQEQTVNLVGELFTTDLDRTRVLCKGIRNVSLPQIRLFATIGSEADEHLVNEMAAAGFAGFVYWFDARSPETLEEGERLTDSLYKLVDEAERNEMVVQVHVSFTSSYDDPSSVEQLVSDVAAACPKFTYDWPVTEPGGVPPQDALHLPELVSSNTFQEEKSLEQAIFLRFQRLTTGLYGETSGLVESALDLSWEPCEAPIREQEWLLDVLSFNSSLFTNREEPAKKDNLPAPLGEVYTVTKVESERGEDKYKLDAGGRFSMLDYTSGRELLPTEPTVLTADTREDVLQFLADADTAREQGIFPRAFCHPLTIMRDMCRWGGSGQCATPRLARMAVDGDNFVRPSPTSPVVGSVGDPFSSMLDRVQERARKLYEARGCKSCHVQELCSQCQCLPECISDEEYCEWRRERPWLAWYTAIPTALSRLPAIHPELASSEGVKRLHVSNFGGPLYYDGNRQKNYRPAPLLLRVGEQHYIFEPGNNKLVRVAKDLAIIYESMTNASEPQAATQWLTTHLSLSPEKVLEATKTVRSKLEKVGIILSGTYGDKSP